MLRVPCETAKCVRTHVASSKHSADFVETSPSLPTPDIAHCDMAGSSSMPSTFSGVRQSLSQELRGHIDRAIENPLVSERRAIPENRIKH